MLPLFLGVFLRCAYLLLGMLIGRMTEGIHPGTAGFSLQPPNDGAFISYDMNTIEMSNHALIVLTYLKFAFFSK